MSRAYLFWRCSSRKQELTDLATGNLLSSFYERLQETRNYHRRFANNFASLTAPVDDSKDTQLHGTLAVLSFKAPI